MKFYYDTQSISLKDEHENVLAYIQFPQGDDGIIVITHTFVDERLRGQHVAAQLMEKAVDYLKAHGKIFRVSCSYAEMWVKQHPHECEGLVIK